MKSWKITIFASWYYGECRGAGAHCGLRLL